MDIFKFSIFSRGSGFTWKATKTAEPIIMVVFPLLSLKKGQVNYLNSKGIKAASIGKGKLCKWRLEVVSFISICATS